MNHNNIIGGITSASAAPLPRPGRPPTRSGEKNINFEGGNAQVELFHNNLKCNLSVLCQLFVWESGEKGKWSARVLRPANIVTQTLVR